MKKESKYINNNSNGLKESYLFVERDPKERLVMANFEDEFVIVDEFSDESQLTVNPYQEEVVEDDEGFIYAEEIFDDEDDIYANGIHDTKVQKAKRRSFKEIGDDIDKFLPSNGFMSETAGHDLISAMFFSRLINVKNKENIDAKIVALMNCFKNGRNVISTFEEENIAYNETFQKALVAAKGNTNRPTFIYLSNIPSKNLFNYLKPIYPYVDNPTGDSYVTARGASIKMPANLWILFTIPEGDVLFDISRRLLRFVSIMDINMEECRPVPTKEELTLSREELRATLNEVNENRVLLEDSWKKIDSLASLIGSANGYEVQNKIALRLEDFCSTLFCKDNLTEDDILDIALSRNIITEAIITSNPNVYYEEVNLFNEIDNSFGMGRLPLTREIIEAYLNLFDEGGQRKND